MKNVICLVISLVCFNILADKMFIPRTSTSSMRESSLEDGEVAFERNEDGTASMWVGSYGKFLPVYPQMTLKGNGVRKIGSDEFFVSAPQGYTFNTEDKLWHDANAVCTTNQLIVTLQDGVTIKSLDYTLINEYIDLVPIKNADVTYTISGNKIIFTLARYNILGTLAIGEFELYAVEDGSSYEENDLTKVDFALRDNIGSIRLSGLREWARDLYNGNRGEDWAKYKATDSAKLNGERLIFDPNDSYEMAYGYRSNLVIRASSYDVIDIYSTNTTEFVGTIGVSSIFATNGVVTIVYTNTIPNFDSTKIKVKAWGELSESPEWVLPNQMTITANTIVMTGQPTDHCFYRLYYGAKLIDDIIVNFNSVVKFNNSVVINGSCGWSNLTANVGAQAPQSLPNYLSSREENTLSLARADSESIVTREIAKVKTTYTPTNVLVSLNQSVQYVEANGSALTILAPTTAADAVRDWLVYVNATADSPLNLDALGGILVADAAYTNACAANKVTALYITEMTNNVYVIGRQELTPVK